MCDTITSMADQPAVPPLVQLLAQCRTEPLVADEVLAELCPELEQAILQRMAASQGRSTQSLNVGGWKSPEDFFSWPVPAVQKLRECVVELTNSAQRLVAWAMVNRAGSHHPRHQHRAALLTGLYYVTPGNEEEVTPTCFECADGTVLEVEPHPGRLVIFRGETWHWVTPVVGDEPRITIAFDLRR